MVANNTSGVYCLYWDLGDYTNIYIGYASDLYNRKAKHLSLLKYSKHHNYKLQNIYTALGEPNFYVLEHCSISSLALREVYWIKTFNSYKHGLNLTEGGEGIGFGEMHPASLCTNKEYLTILQELAFTNKTALEISKNLKVPISVVQGISCGSGHAYLKELDLVAYDIVKNKKGARVSASSSAKDKGISYPLLVSPLGKIQEVYNIREFSRLYNLDQSALGKVLNYKQKKA